MDTYSDFYKNLINVWKYGGKDGGEGGWASYYYGVFSKIIKDNNFKHCAEIGIGYGFHAREILENTNVELLYLVDPMCFYENDTFATDVVNYGGFDLLEQNIRKHLSDYKQRYIWYKKPSIEITNREIPDNSLDAVFIDADHSYEAVTKDLNFWWKKLKIGGWLLGDDYKSCHPGTTRAVDEFTHKNNLQIEFLYKENRVEKDYPIYKFIKQ